MEKICEFARMNSSSGGTGVERVTKACGRGNVPVVKSVRLRKRDERAVGEQVIEEFEVGAQLVPLSSGRLVLMCLSNATNSAWETLFAFSMNVLLQL